MKRHGKSFGISSELLEQQCRDNPTRVMGARRVVLVRAAVQQSVVGRESGMCTNLPTYTRGMINLKRKSNDKFLSCGSQSALGLRQHSSWIFALHMHNPERDKQNNCSILAMQGCLLGTWLSRKFIRPKIIDSESMIYFSFLIHR